MLRTPVTTAAWIGTLGELPQNYPNSPWDEREDGGTVTLTNGVMRISTATALEIYYRKLFSSDDKTQIRSGDRIDVQAKVRLVSTDISPVVGIIISDGYRVAVFSIGSSVEMLTPTGVLITTIAATAPFPLGGVLRIVKDGTSGWTVWIDGREIVTVPYHYAELATVNYRPPGVAFGHLNQMATTISDWSEITYAVNTSVAPLWKLARYRDTMPVALLKRWTSVHDALLRTVIGAGQDTEDAGAQLAGPAWTADRLVTFDASGDGSGLPGDGNNLEVRGNIARLSVVRQRIRVASAATAGPDGVKGTWGADLNFAAQTEYRVKATIVVRSINATGAPNNLVGPFLEVRQNYVIQARLQYDSSGYFWNLFNPSTAIAYSVSWRVGVEAPLAHTIEMQVLGTDRVLLLVDGTITAEIPYSLFATVGNTTTDHYGSVGRFSTATQQVEIDLTDITIQRRDCDLERRPLLQMRATDRLIAFGGCERNDRLETWIHQRHQVMAARGTRIGTLVELARIACTTLITTDVEVPFAWYVGVSFPAITPVYLGVDTFKAVSDIFMGIDAPVMTVQDIATWAAYHLLPTSTIESPFYVGIWFQATALFTLVGVLWSAPYDSTDETDAAVPAGKIIEIRNSSQALPVNVRVVSSGSGVLVVTGADLTGYGSTPYICARLAQS